MMVILLIPVVVVGLLAFLACFVCYSKVYGCMYGWMTR